ncbi:unnamed protein product [Rotaria sordida]|uniref:Uncharacterized protein n=1 Tax=Rotaria sordida TaxID=392033 RepID=A0A814XXJ9_9BILA|nr:unnamed protein product [Rotaria sordida]CAF1501748.1 unnamed protein product [Rotaria sordida]
MTEVRRRMVEMDEGAAKYLPMSVGVPDISYCWPCFKDTNIKIPGQIGRIIECFPLQFDATSARKQDKNEQSHNLQAYYQLLWKQMEQRTFTLHQSIFRYSKTKNIKSNANYIKK